MEVDNIASQKQMYTPILRWSSQNLEKEYWLWTKKHTKKQLIEPMELLWKSLHNRGVPYQDSKAMGQ